MLKYGSIALVCFFFLYTVYQLYLNTAWTKLVRNKQSQFTQTPTVKSDNKRLYHQMEVCAVTLVAVLFLPTTGLKSYSADAANYYVGNAESMEDDSNVAYDLSRVDEDLDNVNDSYQKAPMATTVATTKKASVINGSVEVSKGMSDYSISVKTIDENASKEEVEAFLKVWSSKEWIEAEETSIPDPQQIITIINEENKVQDLFFKSDSDRYWLCLEEGPKCYYTKK